MGVTLATGVVDGVRYDLRTLHHLWMAVAFAQLRDAHPVLGRWTPKTTGQRVAYRAWAALGAIALLVAYPLALAGFATRFYVRGLDRTSARLGVVGTVLLAVVVWGTLTAVARLRFSTEGFLAVAAAATVAVAATVLALAFSHLGGRVTTIVFAYPFAVVAIFLPPVVAALYSPVLAGVIFPRSTTLAAWLLDTVFAFSGLNAVIRDRFELVGFAYVGMWAGLSVPVGWALGVLVTLANLVRPTDEDGTEGDDGE